MGQLLREKRPTMLIEVQINAIADEIQSIISGMGYQVFLVHERLGIISSKEMARSAMGTSTSYSGNQRTWRE